MLPPAYLGCISPFSVEKLSIISELKIFLSELAEKTTLENVQVVNDQKEITFQIGVNEYSVTLTKHRPPKKGA